MRKKSDPEEALREKMEKRTGTVIISVEDRAQAPALNAILSKHADIILCRVGYPRLSKNSIITILIEGTTDRIGALTGQLGRLSGIEVKSALLKPRNDSDDETALQD